MKLFILLCFFISCTPGSKSESPVAGNCPNAYVVMNLLEGTRCIAIPDSAPMEFVLPFDSKTEVVCTHSLGIGSHKWKNSYFSLDLATSYDHKPSTIRAAANGLVLTSSYKCKNPSGSPEKTDIDSCGNSWGNWIKIYHGNGYFSFYSHLSSIQVKTGDRLKTGDPIGLEGWTGAAGHRHLHWSVQKIEIESEKEFLKSKDYVGISVPFRFKAILNSKKVLLDTKNFECPHANIGDAPEQPKLRGIKNLEH